MPLQDYEKRHLSQVRRLAPECVVILKKNGDFPLKQAGEIALYGSGARKTIKGGTGSGDVNSRFNISIEQGLEKAGFKVTTGAWLDRYDAVIEEAHKAFIADIKAKAKANHTNALMAGMGAVMSEPEYEFPLDGDGDTAIYVLGRISGEGNDRKPEKGDICLSDTEVRDILACKEKYAHFMLVLNVGGVVDLTPVLDVENILYLSQLGSVTGDVLADIVLGKRYPSGKLASTWSAWEDYATIGDFGDPNDTNYKEGVYVGYRYFDSIGKKALFPFGFGLSYTEFTSEVTSVFLEGTQVRITASVTNTGAFPGKEILQAYVTCPWGTLDQPYQKLAGFGKTAELAPGEMGEVCISFRLEDLASYDEAKAAYVLEKGNYIVRVGTSSADTEKAAVISLPEDILVRPLKNVGGNPGFEDWKPENTWADEDLTGVEVIEADPAAFAAIEWPESKAPRASARACVKDLSNEDLVYLTIGSFGAGGVLSVIGSASSRVAGAAGETTDKISGVPAVVMADGPAGLRLSKEYTIGKDGKAKSIGSALPAGMDELMPGPMVALLNLTARPGRNDIVLNQFCTSIPIGTALAMSWNPEVCEACGDIVGREMERFGVHLWLAPAFNIHRSPLCGRNFEYCSEDPMIGGLVGAAITKGVQKHPGRGTTIKHFFCNNQETNRYMSNTHVSERALREIYLKGFEICIRESAPAALMTSYNLVNGTHTSERGDIIKGVLRDEWGYRGLVMTDWVISMMSNKDSVYRMAKAAPTIKAGNDVFMPGSSSDYKNVLTALQGKNPEFSLTREEVEFCAARVVETAWALAGKP